MGFLEEWNGYKLLVLGQLSAVVLEDLKEFGAEEQQGNHVRNNDEANGHISDIVSPHCQTTAPYFR